MPERAADALVGAGNRARRRMESRSAIDYYERALGAGVARGPVGRPRGACAGGHGRSALLARASTRPPPTRSERAEAIGERTDDASTLALALRFLGDIAINVEADLDKAEQLLDRSLAAAEELGDPWAIVRTLLFAGWVPWTRGTDDEAEAIWRRALEVADPDDTWARDPRAQLPLVNRDRRHGRGQLRGARGGARAERGGERPRRVDRRPVQHRDDHGAAGARAGGPRAGRGGRSPASTTRSAIFEELGARWEFADALAERGIVHARAGPAGRGRGRPPRARSRISEELGELQLAIWTWRALARVAERRGDHEEAATRRRRADEAVAAFRRSAEVEAGG